MNDMVKLLPFSATVKATFVTTSRLREPFGQVLLATAHDEVGTRSRNGLAHSYPTVETFETKS